MSETPIARVLPWQALQRTLAAAVRLPLPGPLAPADAVVQSWLVRALRSTRPAQ